MITQELDHNTLKKNEILFNLPPEISQALDEAVFSSQEPQQVLKLVLDTALQLLGAEYGSLRWVNRRTRKLVLKAIRLRSGKPISTSGSQDLNLDGYHIVCQVARTKEPLLISDLSEGDWVRAYHPLDAQIPMRSELAVPLLSSDGKVVTGVLNVESPEPNVFTLQHQSFLMALARRAQLVIQRAQLTEAIRILGQKVLSMDQDALLTYTVEAISELMQVPVCSIWLINEEGLMLTKAFGRPEPTSKTPDIHLSRTSFIGQVISTKQPISSTNVQQESNFIHLDLAKEQGWVSALVIPILSANKEPLGVICVYSINEERIFTSYDYDIVTSFSNHVAIALKQAQLLHDQNQRLKVMSGLQEVNEALVTATDLSGMLNLIVQKTTYLLDGAGGILYLIDERQGQNVAVAATGIAETTRGMRTALINSLSGWVVHHNKAIISDAADNRIDWNIARRVNLRNVVAAPLSQDDKVIGALVVLNKQGESAQFGNSDRNLLNILATQATIAINKMRLHEQTKRQSKELYVITNILSESLASTDVKGILLKAALRISQVLGYQAVNIGMVDLDQHIFQWNVRYHSQETTSNHLTSSPGNERVNDVMATGRWMILPDISKISSYETYPDIKSALVVPIMNSKGTAIGILNVESNELEAFSYEDVKIFQAIAAGITVAIENTQKIREITTAEQKYKRLYESARDAIVILNPQGVIVGANQETSRMTGFSHTELVGMNVAKLIVNDQMADQVRERITRLAQGQEIPITEIELQRKDKRTLFIEANPNAYLDDRGQVIEIQSIWRDITARKHDEAKIRKRNEQLNALLMISRVAFRDLDRDSLLSQVATEVMRHLEADGCYVYLIKDDSEMLEPFIAPGSKFARQAMIRRPKLGEGLAGEALKTGKAILNSSHYSNKKDKFLPFAPEDIAQNWLIQPMKARQGILGLFCVARFGNRATQLFTQEDGENLERDTNFTTLVLENMRLNEIEHRQRAATKVLEQVGLVSGFLAHKLGNLLPLVAASAWQLQNHLKSKDPSVNQLLKILEMNIHKADHLWQQFDSMRKPLKQPNNVVLLELLVRIAVEQANIPSNIKLICENLTLPPVRANGLLLIEVFQGVISNAVEAMPEGGTLTISGSTTHDQYETRLHFKDTGHGMSQKRLNNDLFRPFFTSKGQGRGIGIGLWLSRLYLQTLGGNIEATSILNQGSTFTIHLPAVQGTVSPLPFIIKPGEQIKTTNWSNLNPSHKISKVLVVDDYQEWRDFLAVTLKERGFQVQVAESYEEAIRLFNMTRFDAFVVDVRLVDYDEDNLEGLKFVDQLLAHNLCPPIVIFSSYSDPLEIAREKFAKHNNVIILPKAGIEKALDALFGTL